MPRADMSLLESAAIREFRSRVRHWFEINLPAGWGTEAFERPASLAGEVAFLRDWQRRLFDGGWAGLSWPVDYGGAGATLIEQAVFQAERDRVKAPDELGLIGIGMVGPMLMSHGTAEQKQNYLRPMLTGDDIWCQGFSEPSSGSDLASLQTRATRDGAGWVVNGQKVWTSRATAADLMILLARTDPKAPKHKGISAFIVPMSAAGLDVRPIAQMNGAHDFSEVFFDDVHLNDDALIGEVDHGWDVAVNTLQFERVASTRAFEMRRLVRDLVEQARVARPDAIAPFQDPVARDAIAALAADAVSGVAHFMQTIASMQASGRPEAEASIDKLHTTELSRRISGLAVSLLGPDVLRRPSRPWFGGPVDFTWEFTTGFKHTIAAGTSQIQRDIIGTRVLGLPR